MQTHTIAQAKMNARISRKKHTSTIILHHYLFPGGGGFFLGCLKISFGLLLNGWKNNISTSWLFLQINSLMCLYMRMCGYVVVSKIPVWLRVLPPAASPWRCCCHWTGAHLHVRACVRAVGVCGCVCMSMVNVPAQPRVVTRAHAAASPRRCWCRWRARVRPPISLHVVLITQESS